jgi:hypothetical protein
MRRLPFFKLVWGKISKQIAVQRGADVLRVPQAAAGGEMRRLSFSKLRYSVK